MKPDEREPLVQQTQSWSDRLGAAFWDAYRETIGGIALWPAEETQQRRLLDLFLLEKALYEIEYELSNRPAWAGIPIDATLRILSARGVNT